MAMSIGGQQASRNQVLILAALATVFVGLLLYMFVFSGGGEEPTVTTPVPVSEAAAPKAKSKPKKAEPAKLPTAKKGPVETSKVFASKDPFEPLVDESATAGTSSEGSDVSGAVTETSAPSGSTVVTGDQVQGSTVSDPTQTVNGRKVKLVSVFTKNLKTKARIQVDGTVYKVSQGEVFATNFKLVSFSGDCASVLYGDVEFTLCESATN